MADFCLTEFAMIDGPWPVTAQLEHTVACRWLDERLKLLTRFGLFHNLSRLASYRLFRVPVKYIAAAIGWKSRRLLFRGVDVRGLSRRDVDAQND